jgi:hypothetical protein
MLRRSALLGQATELLVMHSDVLRSSAHFAVSHSVMRGALGRSASSGTRIFQKLLDTSQMANLAAESLGLKKLRTKLRAKWDLPSGIDIRKKTIKGTRTLPLLGLTSYSSYAVFFRAAFTFAHLARWAAAIFFRAAADIVFFGIVTTFGFCPLFPRAFAHRARCAAAILALAAADRRLAVPVLVHETPRSAASAASRHSTVLST